MPAAITGENVKAVGLAPVAAELPGMSDKYLKSHAPLRQEIIAGHLPTPTRKRRRDAIE